MEDTNFTNEREATDDDTMKQPRRGKVLTQTSLYSPECLTLLQQALADGGTASSAISDKRLAAKSRYASSSDEEDENASHSESSDGSASAEEEHEVAPAASTTSTTTSQQPTTEAKTLPKPQGKAEKYAQRITDIRVRKYVDTLTCHNFSLRDAPLTKLCLPTSILSKDDSLADHSSVALRAYQQLAQQLQQHDAPIIVLFVRSGRFAGAVFVRGECIDHHTKTTYTIRKGQGKAQSAQDASRRPKSVGSQLRRQGEEKLQEDIAESANRWKSHIHQAALVLLSCPKTMKKTLFESLNGVLSREDARIRRVPLDLGRPTFETALLIHDVLTTVTVREVMSAAVGQGTETAPTETNVNTQSSKNQLPTAAPKEIVDIPLSALHVACKNGDLGVIRDILAEGSNELTVMAGPDLMTPLHYAAASSAKSADPAVAADCVRELLMEGRADPSLLDGRSRPCYFMAAHESVRDAFRIARASLGEDFCDWEKAKVGPPLTQDDLQKRREKEAEKRRKKKARQKQKKAQDKAAAEELEQRRQEEEEKARQVEEAKRIRDGLQPKTNKASNVCDFCQTVCKGRKRSQMFKRLEYAYCSTECVQNHKRELQAAAALARFGGS